MGDIQNEPENNANPELVQIEVDSSVYEPSEEIDVEIKEKKIRFSVKKEEEQDSVNQDQESESKDEQNFYSEKVEKHVIEEVEIDSKKEREKAIVKEKLKPGLYDHLEEKDEQEIQDKLNAEAKGGKKTQKIVVKCDPVYMLRKQYEWNYDLGGELLLDEANERSYDPFYVTMDEITELCTIIKSHQDKRNTVRKEEGNSIRCIRKTNDINEFISRGEVLTNELSRIFGYQAIPGVMSNQEYEEKDEQVEKLFAQLEGVKNRETCARELQHIKPKSEVDLDDIELGFDNIDDANRAPDRDLNQKEKNSLKRWEVEQVEIDFLLGEIDKGMDEVIQGVQDMNEEVNEQKKLLEKRQKEMNEFEIPFNKTALKLKTTLKAWKSAGSVFVQILVILILILLVMALMLVIKALYIDA